MSVQTLPSVKDLVSEQMDMGKCVRQYQEQVLKQRAEYVAKHNLDDNAWGFGMISAVIFFILSWIIPIVLGVSYGIFVPIGVFGGILGGMFAWFFIWGLLSPKGSGLLEPILEKQAKKKFSLNQSFEQTFVLEVSGDQDVGDILVEIRDVLKNKSLYSQMFGMKDEINALDVITEAKNLVIEANSEMRQQYVDHKIEAQGFVNRAVLHSS